MKTRQATLVEPGRFDIREVDVAPGPGQVLVKMVGCGLCTWELNHWAGRLGTCPQALGHEAWGEVVEVGAETTGRVNVGDRVTGLAGQSFSDYYVMPEVHTMRLHSDKAPQAVPGEPLYCIHNVVRAAHPEIGDAVAVVGCGPMGLWSVQALAGKTLQSLIAVDIDDAKLALATEYGATQTVNPKASDVNETVKEITDGRMVDVAVEATGAAAGVQTAIELLRGRRPKLVMCSSFKGPITVDVPKLLGKAVDVLHAHPGICRDLADGCRRTEILANNGVFTVDPLISHRWPIDQINEAFKTMAGRGAGYMKGVIVP